MQSDFFNCVLEATGATDMELIEEIQELWSGYGAILRYGLTGSSISTVVVKHVSLMDGGDHPRGWNTDLGHQRKLRSYQVETEWYTNWAQHCSDECRVPHCLAVEQHGSETVIVLEDLDSAGFPDRRGEVGEKEITACLSWLAWFHATWLGAEPNESDGAKGLWPQGTYWHLETRPDELEALADPALKHAAGRIDESLRECRYRTLVHGDDKLANFCFSRDGDKVAAVDFQYVGGGCGMKDVAYFIGSCLGEEDCERLESWLLNTYFTALKRALIVSKPEIDFQAVEAEWRKLYPYAWADFHRFLKGWSPGHWKLNTYSEKIVRDVVRQLS